MTISLVSQVLPVEVATPQQEPPPCEVVEHEERCEDAAEWLAACECTRCGHRTGLMCSWHAFYPQVNGRPVPFTCLRDGGTLVVHSLVLIA